MELDLAREEIPHDGRPCKGGRQHGIIINILTSILCKIGGNDRPSHAGANQVYFIMASFALCSLHIATQFFRMSHGVEPPIVVKIIYVIGAYFRSGRTHNGRLVGQVTFLIDKLRIVRH